MKEYTASKGFLSLPEHKRTEIQKMMTSKDPEMIKRAMEIIEQNNLSYRNNVQIPKVANAAFTGIDLLGKDRSINSTDYTDTIDVADRNKIIAGGVAEGAVSGGVAGMAFGPVGGAVGAVGGALVNYFKDKSAVSNANEEIVERKNRKRAAAKLSNDFQEQIDYENARPMGMQRGGFVKGKGSKTSDSNRTALKDGDFVIPAPEDDVTDSLVKSFAKNRGLDKPAKIKKAKGDVPVNLSRGELIVPKEKMEPKNMKKGGPIDLERELNNLELAQGGAGVAQAIQGMILQKRNEKAIKENLKGRKRRVAEEESDLMKSKAIADANVNRSYRDTEKTIDMIRRSGAKEMAKNSMTNQEYMGNVAELSAKMGDVTSKAYQDRGTALNDNLARFYEGKSKVRASETLADQSSASFSTAKATQAAGTAKAGFQNIADMVTSKRQKMDRKLLSDTIKRQALEFSEIEKKIEEYRGSAEEKAKLKEAATLLHKFNAETNV
jgi:hypothetical protein